MTSQEKILAAAARQFEQSGYAGTTTLSIAKKAGVSEMTLFRIFKTKENLFHAVLGQLTASGNLSSDRDGFTGDPEHDLTAMAVRILTYFTEKNKVIRMMLFESIRQESLLSLLSEAPRQNIDFLNAYFQQQVRSGVLHCDPAQTTELFLSMLLGYAVGLRSICPAEHPEEALRRFAESAVHTLLSGIQTPEKEN